MLSITLTCHESSSSLNAPQLPSCTLPAVELCVAHPAAEDVWHVAWSPSTPRDLSLCCVSGLPASVALMATPVPLSVVRHLFGHPETMLSSTASSCPCVSCCPVSHGVASSLVPSPTPFLYSYNVDTESHEAGQAAAAVAMATLRRHLLLLMRCVDLGTSAEATCAGPVVRWCGADVVRAVRAHCAVVPLSAAPVVQVRWAPSLVAAVLGSWRQFRDAAEADRAAWCHDVSLPLWVHALAAPELTDREDQISSPPPPPEPPRVVSNEEIESASVRESEAPRTSAQPGGEDDAMEAWSDDGAASGVSELEPTSAPRSRHGDGDSEDEQRRDGGTRGTHQPPLAGASVRCSDVLRGGASPAMELTNIPLHATLLRARAEYADTPKRHSATLCLALQCTDLLRLSQSAQDSWLAARVAAHLLEHFLLPADRHRDDGNDLLRSTEEDGAAEAAEAYIRGAHLAQKGLSYPYTTPLDAIRDVGSYTSADPSDDVSEAAVARWLTSRDAVYRHAQTVSTGDGDAGGDGVEEAEGQDVARFVEQRVWGPMAPRLAAGVFASVLLRVSPLPPGAVVSAALAYASPAVVTRTRSALHPCLAPALAAMSWRLRAADPSSSSSRLPAVTRLQLVWYTLHRTAVALVANAAEATLRSVAAAGAVTSSPVQSVSLGDVEQRARACEKACALVWGLLLWHQPAGAAPDGTSWSAARPAHAQAELLWCFHMFGKLMLRAARLSKCVGDSTRQKNAVWQLQEALRRWTNVRARLAAAAASVTAAEASQSVAWKDVPANTPETLVAEIGPTQWAAWLADVERAIAQV